MWALQDDFGLLLRTRTDGKRQDGVSEKISVIGYVLLCWWRHGSDYAFADWTNHIFYNVSASAFYFVIIIVFFSSFSVWILEGVKLQAAIKFHWNQPQSLTKSISTLGGFTPREKSAPIFFFPFLQCEHLSQKKVSCFLSCPYYQIINFLKAIRV